MATSNQNNSKTKSNEVKAAYAYCQKIAQNHYENFPVASYILPKHIREPITVIYAFARTADDIVDEGHESAEERLKNLDHFTSELDNVTHNKMTNPIFIALQHVLSTHPLPIALFYDLLTAFKQDITQTNYETFDEVLRYCRYSANPIGRLLLHLNRQATPENIILSDNICTGLQLINFIQDIDSDLNDRNRCYIPLEDLRTFHISKDQLQTHAPSFKSQGQELIAFQLERIQQLYDSGKPLSKSLTGLFGLEIRLIIAGGQQILNTLKTRKNIYQRPKLSFLGFIKSYFQLNINK